MPICRSQSGESLADLAGIFEAANRMSQPTWRDAQSAVTLIAKPSEGFAKKIWWNPESGDQLFKLIWPIW